MKFEATTADILAAALSVHRAVGPGMLESAYEAMLAYELTERGMTVQRQKYVDLRYRNLLVERAYCLDLLVDDSVIVEIKSMEKVAPVHLKQVLTYLRLTGLHVGLLLNFGQATLKEGGIHRIVNGERPPIALT